MHMQPSTIDTPGSHPLSAAVAEYLTELSKRTSGDIRTDRYSRVLYSTDASIYRVEPYAIVLPRNAEELQAAVELAAKHQVPVLPRTGGSSLAGQAVNKAVVLDLTRYMDSVLEVNADEHWVRVQPGVVLDALNIHLGSSGLQFGPDPASSNRAAMGGIVANNSTGSHSIAYGMTADHVLETNVFLSDGSAANFGPVENGQLDAMRQRGGLEGKIYEAISQLVSSEQNQAAIQAGTPRHWRRCGGYNLDRMVAGDYTFKSPQDPRFNLAKLACGSEGTLAVMNEIKLNLVPIPTQTALAIIHFDGIYEALAAVPTILEVDPTAVELLDDLGMTLCRESKQFAPLLNNFVEGRPNCILITEFYGENDAELRHKIDRLKDHLRSQGVPAGAVTRGTHPAAESRCLGGPQSGSRPVDEHSRRSQADSIY